jgi:hypothetical protein
VQLEIDSNSPLYAGSRPEESLLKAVLDVLQMKAQYKWSHASIDASLQYWHNLLPDENTCPSSIDKDKKIMCPLDLPHKNYHACFNDCCILSERGHGQDHMSSLQCCLIQVSEESSPKSCVVLSAHSPPAAVFHELQGIKNHALASGKKGGSANDRKRNQPYC